MPPCKNAGTNVGDNELSWNQGTGPLLEVRDLTVEYAGREGRATTPVNGVSFDVHRGEIVGLLGESGSGKTTLALSLLGLLPRGAAIAGGSVRFRGAELLDLGEKHLQKIRGSGISMIFQEPGISLNPVLRVGEQVADVLRAHRHSSQARIRREAEAVMKEVQLPQGDLARIWDAYPHQLSGGQRQRVAIALALACRPSLVIADEPTASLDATVQAEVLDVLKELNQRLQMSILLISHNPAVLATMAQRLLVMRQGRMVEQGSLARIYQRPASPYTQSLLEAAQQRKPESVTAGENAPLVEVRELSKRYAQWQWFTPRVVRALDGVNLTIRGGETLALVGESGSGKTTLARCLACLEDPSAGEIVFEGRNVRGLSPQQSFELRQQIQLIFQDAASSLNPRFTAVEAVAEPLVILRRGRTRAERRQRALELMRQVGLAPEWGGRSPLEFSGGQRQRLAIARALAVEPRLLILDEALSGLDLPVQEQILGLLSELQEVHALTYLYIAHDLTLVERIAERVAVMKAGRIVEEGAVDRVFANPQHDYTRQLVGSAPLVAARQFAMVSA
jgi:ABC-type glutathione transport system ATPase component